MEDKAYIEELVKKARAAQAVYMEFDQKMVNAVTKAVGKIVADNAEILSKEAVEETHFGTVQSKIGKHTKVLAEHWQYMYDKPSVGMIEEDKVNQIKVYAKPMGVVCCLTPSTNPTSTAGANAMCALKAIIVAGHPGAKNCTAHAVALMRQALRETGAPEDLVQCVEDTSLKRSELLMEACDTIIATGGPGMVKAAYSSGTPALGVGQGKQQCVIDRELKYDFDEMVDIIVNSRNYDFGTSCSGEQTCHVPKEMVEKFEEACVRHGAFHIKDKATVDKMRGLTFIDGTINRAIVGKMPHDLGRIYDIGEVPEEAKVLMIDLEGAGNDDVMFQEIMCPVLRIAPYDTYEEGVEHAYRNLVEAGGQGHTTVVWTSNEDHVDYAAKKLPVSRLLINQRGNNGSGNTDTNGLVPTMSLGCGSWGGTATTDNVNFLNLMNKMRVSYRLDRPETPIEEAWNLE